MTLPSTSQEIPVKENNKCEDVTKASLPDSTSVNVNVETDTTIKPEHDEASPCETEVALSQYPWKKNVQLQLDKLSDLTVDIWCNHVSDYYVYTPKITAKLVIVHGYGRKRGNADAQKDIAFIDAKQIKTEVPVETDSITDLDIGNLLSYAENLVQQAKTLVNTDDVGDSKKPSSKRNKKSKKAGQQSTSHVETKPTPNAIDLLHQQTVDKLVPKGPTPPEPRRDRSVHCQLCERTFPSVRDLNVHHGKDHGIVSCEYCDKKFSNQTSLDKHLYVHKELKHVCELCGKKFPFESRLEQHSLVHINNRLSCPIKSCDKQFKGKGDLNHHKKTHKKGGWFMCDFCTYRNKDKRNTASHMRTHQKDEEAPYECDKCHKKNEIQHAI